ncbi:chromate transporter [Niallia sp. Krafla_26]|uniref:chromate transporter n=1 Tax=Niallia sp. Krafla_26 TaxID=3064703 RepID=UPI003D168474
MYLDLFLTFLMIGFISFGGGYAMIPVIEMEVTQNGWLTTQEFTNVIAIAGMSPGPIATNSAIFVGYEIAGLTGAIVSALGMVLPSLLIILVIATFFYKINENHLTKSAFYGLRPIVTGLIIYAAINFAISNRIIGSFSLTTLSALLIFGVSLFALLRLKMHPVFVILLSGVVGMVLYT